MLTIYVDGDGKCACDVVTRATKGFEVSNIDNIYVDGDGKGTCDDVDEISNGDKGFEKFCELRLVALMLW